MPPGEYRLPFILFNGVIFNSRNLREIGVYLIVVQFLKYLQSNGPFFALMFQEDEAEPAIELFGDWRPGHACDIK